MNEQVTAYISQAPEEQRKIMEAIRDIIHIEVTSVTENFKWSRPVFSTDTDFAYFKTAKSYLTFGVFNYNKIKDHQELLEGSGKDMRHIKIKKLEDLQPEIIKSWIGQIIKSLQQITIPFQGSKEHQVQLFPNSFFLLIAFYP